MELSPVDISIIIPFADAEDWLGTTVRQLVDTAALRDLRIEVLALDLGSGDNSHALLGLLKNEISQLQVLVADGNDLGCAASRAPRTN